jgi:hypothetical protein
MKKIYCFIFSFFVVALVMAQPDKKTTTIDLTDSIAPPKPAIDPNKKTTTINIGDTISPLKLPHREFKTVIKTNITGFWLNFQTIEAEHNFGSTLFSVQAELGPTFQLYPTHKDNLFIEPEYFRQGRGDYWTNDSTDYYRENRMGRIGLRWAISGKYYPQDNANKGVFLYSSFRQTTWNYKINQVNTDGSTNMAAFDNESVRCNDIIMGAGLQLITKSGITVEGKLGVGRRYVKQKRQDVGADSNFIYGSRIETTNSATIKFDFSLALGWAF